MSIVSNIIYAITGIPCSPQVTQSVVARYVFCPNRNDLIQCYKSTVLLGYPHTCNQVVIYLSTLENTLQNRPSWKRNFLRLSINAHRKQSFFVFQGLHCL